MKHNRYTSKSVAHNLRKGVAKAALVGVGLSASALPAEAASTAPSAISKGLYAVAHAKKGQHLKVLDGKTEHLEVTKGAITYERSASGVKANKVTSTFDILHGAYEADGDRALTCFKLGEKALCLSLTAKVNQAHVTEIPQSGHAKPFNPADVETSSVKIDLVQNGFAFGQISHDELQGSVQGKPEVPLAQAAN